MDIDVSQILVLCIVAFFAGFVDAIVGGGGLIQTPAALVILDYVPVATVMGSVKIPSFSGTALAAQQFVKKVAINWQLLTIMCMLAFLFSFVGSALLTTVSNHFMKPILLVILIIVAVYTFSKKDFGQHTAKVNSKKREIVYGSLLSITIGFYDGFIGPGTGSFLVLGFITVLHFDFLRSSAYAKLVNLATNLGSIILFTLKGKIIWSIALPMAVCNAAGGALGARLALKKGNPFYPHLFLNSCDRNAIAVYV